jgi:pectate lyase
MGGTVKPGASNIILRNILFAPGYGNRSFNEPTRVPAAGDFPDSYTYDALDISGHDLIIDHITAVYGTDETVSMNELAANITVQYATIAQGQNYPQADAEATGLNYTGHSLGSLFQAGSNAKISILHNLYAHLKGRLPRVGTEARR